MMNFFVDAPDDEDDDEQMSTENVGSAKHVSTNLLQRYRIFIRVAKKNKTQESFMVLLL